MSSGHRRLTKEIVVTTADTNSACAITTSFCPPTAPRATTAGLASAKPDAALLETLVYLTECLSPAALTRNSWTCPRKSHHRHEVPPEVLR